MANYPGSVTTFATKNTGDTIQAAHVNTLQDEVNAIEAGLLNGTARLNSSHSTLVALSVTGGSTIGTLQAGASTVASLSVSGASTVTTLQAGASTMTSLSVSGGSTLTTLNVSGGSTFTGGLSVQNNSTLANVNITAGLNVPSASSLHGAVALTGTQTATLSTGNTNNFVLSTDASILLLSAPAGGSTLTGISGGFTGRLLTLLSTSGQSWVIGLNNAGSSADCRIFGEGAAGSTTILTLTKRAVLLQYVNSQWIVFAGQ